MSVRLAPSWSAAGARIAAFAMAATLVVGVMWMDRGPPSYRREVRQDEVKIFRAKPRGVIQFALESALVVGIAWVGRRKLKVRL